MVNGCGADGARNLVKHALDECRQQIGLPVLGLNEANPPRIEYVGPLESKPRTLKLDLSDDELVMDTTILPIVQRYEDQGQDECLAYTLEEIAAEKLRCVLQRLQCRDLYDLHELLVVRGVDVQSVWPTFERKAHHRGYNPDSLAERFDQCIPEWEHRWKSELDEYTASAPHFDGLLRAVRRELRAVLA